MKHVSQEIYEIFTHQTPYVLLQDLSLNAHTSRLNEHFKTDTSRMKDKM
jgi:hypothetical protein